MERTTTADRLKQIMESRNLRQVDIIRLCDAYSFAFNIPITKSNLSLYLKGRVVPSQEKLFLLSCALDVSEQWLLGFDVPMERDEKKSKEYDSAAFFELMRPEDRILLFDVLKNPDSRKRLVSYAQRLKELQKMEEAAGSEV